MLPDQHRIFRLLQCLIADTDTDLEAIASSVFQRPAIRHLAGQLLGTARPTAASNACRRTAWTTGLHHVCAVNSGVPVPGAGNLVEGDVAARLLEGLVEQLALMGRDEWVSLSVESWPRRLRQRRLKSPQTTPPGCSDIWRDSWCLPNAKLAATPRRSAETGTATVFSHESGVAGISSERQQPNRSRSGVAPRRAARIEHLAAHARSL